MLIGTALMGVMGVEMEVPEDMPDKNEGTKPSTGNAGLDLGLFEFKRGRKIVSPLVNLRWEKVCLPRSGLDDVQPAREGIHRVFAWSTSPFHVRL